MRKYKLLKPLPGYPVGYIFEQDSWGNISFITSVDTVVFPDFFEEIKEPSDEEVLAEWIFEDMMGYQQKCFEPTLRIQKDGRRLEPDDFLGLACRLIAKGFDVSKLREGK